MQILSLNQRLIHKIKFLFFVPHRENGAFLGHSKDNFQRRSRKRSLYLFYEQEQKLVFCSSKQPHASGLTPKSTFLNLTLPSRYKNKMKSSWDFENTHRFVFQLIFVPLQHRLSRSQAMMKDVGEGQTQTA